MAQDGSIDHAASLALKNNTTPLTLGERLTGRTLTEDYQKIDPKTGEAKLETITSYRPGLLNDITGGYNENRYTPVSLSNFGQNTTADGRNKGFAYRLGEGLGSLAKFAESPLGRSLLVGGIVGATGGSGLEALAYGAKTGMLNQGNRSADRIYRDDLIRSQQTALRNSPEFANMKPAEQQAQLQAIADNIYSQRGYLNKDIYSNLIKTQQMRDNADWKKMYFDAQQKNLEAQREWQRQQAEMQRADKAADRAYQYYNANLNHQDRMAALEAKQNGKTFNQRTQNVINKNGAAIAQINALISLLEKSKDENDPSYGATGFWQGVQAESPFRMVTQNLNNNSTDEQIMLRSQLADLGSMTITDRTGTAQTVHELKRLRPFIADAYDKPETAISKLKSMRNNLLNETNYYLNSEGLSLEDVGGFKEGNTGGYTANSDNNDPLGIL